MSFHILHLVSFHEELQQASKDPKILVAGPYWGMNLVLWARSLVHYPAIGLGTGARYFLSGGILTQPQYAKVAIGLARGKREYDKRRAIAEREARREEERALSERQRGK